MMNKSSFLLSFLFAWVFPSAAQAVEYTFLESNKTTPSQVITLATGDIAEVTSIKVQNTNTRTGSSGPTGDDGHIEVTRPSGASWRFFGAQNIPHLNAIVDTSRAGAVEDTSFRRFLFCGPCTLQLKGTDPTMAIVKVTRAVELGSASSGGVSAQYATVIPENLSSNVKLRLQQSTDLINWTDVQPGDFTPSAQKRFFRVNSEVIRAVAITGATSANPIVITAPAHGFSTGNQVQISGVQGNVSANGVFTITVVDANTFSLNGAGPTAAAYTSGGTAKKL